MGFCCKRTILLVDLGLDVEVDAGNDDVGYDVEGAHAVEHIRVIEWDLFRDLHKPQDDDQVGTIRRSSKLSFCAGLGLPGLRTFAG